MDLLLTASSWMADADDVAGAAVDGSYLGLVVFVAIALGVSFLCSIWEAVLLSTPRSHIGVLVEQGSAGGKQLQHMRREVDRPISAILTLNTVAHTVGAAGAGAEATALFGSAWFGVISAVLTLLILIFSEIIPKTLGTVYCRGLAPFTGVSLTWLVRLLGPVVWVLEFMTRLLKPKEQSPTVTRADLQALAAISAEEGGLDADEALTFHNLLRLEQVRVKEVMTPRTVIEYLDERATVGEVLDGDLPRFSRLPISPHDADDISAYVLRSELLERGIKGERDTVLKDFAHPLVVVPLGASVADAFDRLLGQRHPMLLVADEFGGTAGVVTLEDTLETLLGREIMDESDRTPDLRELAREKGPLDRPGEAGKQAP